MDKNLLADLKARATVTTHGYENAETKWVSLNDFGDLIIKECGRYLMSPEFIGRSDLDWSMVLNEHFGVKGK